VAALDAHPRVGLVHTRFHMIDASGEVIEADTDWTGGLQTDVVESGDEFERESMLYSCRVCASTALLRKQAVPPWGFRPEDEPPFDFACWLAMTPDWDFEFIARPLCRYRIHEKSFTSGQADATDSGYLARIDSVRALRRVKQEHIDRFHSPGPRRTELERLADRRLRHELVVRVRQATLPGRSFKATASGLGRLARAEPTLLRDRDAWALLAGSVVGQRGVTTLRRYLPGRSS
jgi:hypothetical protein